MEAEDIQNKEGKADLATGGEVSLKSTACKGEETPKWALLPSCQRVCSPAKFTKGTRPSSFVTGMPLGCLC